MPPEPPPISQRWRRLILAAAAVTTTAATLSTAFLPYLWTNHPIVFLLLSADARNLVLVAPQLDLSTVLAIAIPRRVLAMFVTYGVASIYGRSMLAWSARKLPRLARLLAFCERVFLRFPRALLLLWPAYTPNAIAGMARMSVRRFTPWMIAGQVVYVVVAFYAGAAMSAWTDELMSAVSRYVWETTAICAALVALQQAISYVRRRRARGLVVPSTP